VSDDHLQNADAPDMYEIYSLHADRYDELVESEDSDGNLRRFLRERIVQENMRVVEAGVGTGRVTRFYVDLAREVRGFDRSLHMLSRAQRNLGPWEDKLVLAVADHLRLPVADGSADLFIEGWSFGHRILDSPDDVQQVTGMLVSEAARVVGAGGRLTFIETLGTNVETAHPPLPVLGDFYDSLETDHGFEKHVIRTDYLFPSLNEAVRICGFFFGEEMARTILATNRSRSTDASVRIPEFTGVWSRLR